MGLEFRWQDFAFPASILLLKRQFDRNQWVAAGELRRYQLARLRRILAHASRHVPYYRRVLRERGLAPEELRTDEDLRRLPDLTRAVLRERFAELTADGVRRYRPTLLSTSGTTGSSVRFYVDKAANVQEFVYYWRQWGWAGYRLGQPFAELSVEHFTSSGRRRDALHDHQVWARRLLLNSLLLSRQHLDAQLALLRRHRPLFLKGLPGNLYLFALLCGTRPDHGVKLQAVFSQGEQLLEAHRRVIERTFGCPVFDSYGHLERTVAISQCPAGTYHVHSDYGLLQLEEVDPGRVAEVPDGCYVAEIVGTSLHNLAMPLIRYRTGDLALVPRSPRPCPCGRGLPTIVGIAGRSSDAVLTPDGRAITALYVALHRTPGLLGAQIVQERLEEIVVRFACDERERQRVEAELVRQLRELVGPALAIRPDRCPVEELAPRPGEKWKSVVSRLSPETILR